MKRPDVWSMKLELERFAGGLGYSDCIALIEYCEMLEKKLGERCIEDKIGDEKKENDDASEPQEFAEVLARRFERG